MNKKVFYVLVISLLLINNGCNTPKNSESKQQVTVTKNGYNVQENAEDKQIELLKEFYTSYAAIWSEKPLPHPDIVRPRSDSLAAIYCTSKFKIKVKEESKDGFDLLTDDWGFETESLKTLEIKKDSTAENSYVVSYNIIYLYHMPPIHTKEYKIDLFVNVVKEGEQYKIDGVKGNGVLLNTKLENPEHDNI